MIHQRKKLAHFHQHQTVLNHLAYAKLPPHQDAHAKGVKPQTRPKTTTQSVKAGLQHQVFFLRWATHNLYTTKWPRLTVQRAPAYRTRKAGNTVIEAQWLYTATPHDSLSITPGQHSLHLSANHYLFAQDRFAHARSKKDGPDMLALKCLCCPRQ